MRFVLAIVLTLLAMVSWSAEKADHVLVVKSERTLTLYNGEKVLGVYSVTFGANPKGHKQLQGDERTPEGKYVLDYKKSESAFYKAIHVSYPNASDTERARKRGVSPGGDIMIHGQKNGFGWASPVVQYFNWTDGCIALSNADMDAVWAAVEAGTPIEIKP